MSSTEERDRLLRSYFEEVLVPLARRIRAERGPLFPHGPEPDAASTYVLREKPMLEKADFELNAAESPEDVGRELIRLWKDDPHLAPLVPSLVALMPALAPEKEQSGDVSPFIYVMF